MALPTHTTLPTSSSTAEHLRRRAVGLRSLARALQALDVLDLHRHAGTDVWVGPSQQHWHDTLQSDRAALVRGGHELLVAARRLERRADDLDLAGPPSSGHVR
jgi:hypothetical protein